MMRKNQNKGSENRQQNWSDLPHDILLLISSKISSSFFDMLSLKEVCSSWRTAMNNRTKIAYPMIVLSEENIKKTFNNGIRDISLLGIIDNSRYKLKKTPWFLERSTGRIIGSHPDGWLIILDQFRVPHIFHLFLKIQIDLPNKILSTNRRLIPLNEVSIRKAILFVNDPNRGEDFIVVMGYYGHLDMELCIWRLGEINWSCFGGCSLIFDMAFFNNKLYVINGYKHIESWDLKSNPYLPERELCIHLSDRMVSAAEHRLVVSLVEEILILTIKDWGYPSKLFIHKLDLCTKKCIEVNSLNEQTVFTCFGGSVVLSYVDIGRLGYNAGCIYLMEEEIKHIELSMHRIDNSKCELIWKIDADSNYKTRPAAFFVVRTI